MQEHVTMNTVSSLHEAVTQPIKLLPGTPDDPVCQHSCCIALFCCRHCCARRLTNSRHPCLGTCGPSGSSLGSACCVSLLPGTESTPSLATQHACSTPHGWQQQGSSCWRILALSGSSKRWSSCSSGSSMAGSNSLAPSQRGIPRATSSCGGRHAVRQTGVVWCSGQVHSGWSTPFF